jgi:hypothetical protein
MSATRSGHVLVLYNPVVAQLAGKPTALFGSRSFTTVFTRTRCLYLPEPDESNPHPSCIRTYILILSSFAEVFLVVSFLKDLQQKIVPCDYVYVTIPLKQSQATLFDLQDRH